MKKLKPIKELDFVFFFFKENDQEYEVHVLLEELKKVELEIDILKLERIINKLHKDEMIDCRKEDYFNDPNNVGYFYKISYNGYIFKGYVTDACNSFWKNLRGRCQTLILVVGTGLAGLYGLFEMLKWLFHHEHWTLIF